MLVVTRREGERIVLPDVGVEIVIARVFDTGAVRVGVAAPPEVRIFRKELLAEPAKTGGQHGRD